MTMEQARAFREKAALEAMKGLIRRGEGHCSSAISAIEIADVMTTRLYGKAAMGKLKQEAEDNHE